MTHEELFVRTIADLRSKVDGDEYNLIRACGLLRQLIIDSPTLYDLANRNKKIKAKICSSGRFERQKSF